MMSKCCFWSAVYGDHTYMLEASLDSYRKVGMTEDFIVFSERDIKGATDTYLDNSVNKGGYYWFKYNYLMSDLRFMDYDYFIWSDADNYFVRKPQKFPERALKYPVWCLLETDLFKPSSIKSQWLDVTVEDIIEVAKSIGLDYFYTLNGAMWGIHKKAIPRFWDIVRLTREIFHSRGLEPHSEEIYTSFAAMFIDKKFPLLKENMDLYATDFSSNHCVYIPHGEPFDIQLTHNYGLHNVNPAIVHAQRAKQALIELGKSLHVGC